MSEDSSVPDSTQSRSTFLRDEIRLLRQRRGRVASLSRVYFALGLLLLFASGVVYFYFGSKIAWICAGYGVPFVLFPVVRSPRVIDTDILTLENELDLIETTEVSTEQRAEKLFKHHQYELQKYYDQTLRHSKWIFLVGVACIFVGFLTIGITFYLVAAPVTASQRLEEKILVAVLGGVGSILANFIAVIYLRMFSEILKSVTDFHNRLVGTHNLYFANFMSTKVTDATMRDGIFSDIAKNLTKA